METSTLNRYQKLCILVHQRKLEESEVAELQQLSQQLNKSNPINPTQASVYAKIAILNSQNQVLILWRSPQSPMPGRVDLPGGGLDFGEHPDEGAKREAQEEVGLILDQVKLIFIGNFIHKDQYQIMFGYASQIQNQPVNLSWEHDRFAWLNLDQAMALPDLPARHQQLLIALKTASQQL
jgi:8-oxo-dGTP diphosphatase